MEEKSKNKIHEKMETYFDESINNNNYRSEQIKERLNLRKNKIFNILFSKRKEGIDNTIKGPIEIDINKLNCDENIKKDVDNYIKTIYDVKNWFKHIFSKNKNEIYIALYLLRKYIDLQIIELPEKKRILSRNDTELIQKLCDNLLTDDLKVSYYSLICITNLTLFPTNVEKRICSERNLEKYLKFFDIITKNINLYTHKALYLFLNISTDNDVKLYLIKHNFLESLYDFIKNIINNNIKFNNDLSELGAIETCLRILYQLILVCRLFDKNYIKHFTKFIPFLKIITSKYFVNIDNIAFNEDKCKSCIGLWIYYTDFNDEENAIANEIIKDNFGQILIKFYLKLKNVDNKILFSEIFCNLSYTTEVFNNILINDGLISLLNDEIVKYQYSNVNLLKKLIFCCSNISLGTIGENKKLIQLGIIYRIMDITIFYIDDKLDDEILMLLIHCLFCLTNNILGTDRESKKQIIIYKNSLIIKIFCKALKLDLKEFEKDKIIEKIIYSINDLNVISEEIDETKEKEYDIACISNNLVEILNKLSNKSNLADIIKENMNDLIEFIKDKEKYI